MTCRPKRDFNYVYKKIPFSQFFVANFNVATFRCKKSGSMSRYVHGCQLQAVLLQLVAVRHHRYIHVLPSQRDLLQYQREMRSTYSDLSIHKHVREREKKKATILHLNKVVLLEHVNQNLSGLIPPGSVFDCLTRT